MTTTATDALVPTWRGGVLRRLQERALDLTDPAGLAAFRIAIGAVLCGSVVRFWAYGWIEDIYLRPSFHFTYFGFDWVRPFSPLGMYLWFGVMGAAALCLCVGFWTRLSAAVFCLTFSYAELIEKASYLNHYYFVSLVALLLSVLPSGATWSLDAWRRRQRGLAPLVVRRHAYALLRAQLALVYFYAGFAKLNLDWLGEAQPLRTWLALHADAPGIGPWLATPAVAYAASYAGAFYDLTVPVWLSWKKSRPFAFVAVVLFHIGVWLLFPIGVFSWVMIASTTLFFEPSWPRRWLARLRLVAPSHAATEWSGAAGLAALPSRASIRAGFCLGAAYLALQVLVPLRFLLYAGNVNWHDQGFRFSWRVMLVEKAGQVEFIVVTGEDDRRHVVYPRQGLTPLQYKMMCTQPDMIHEYARHLKRTFSERGHTHVRVYAEAWASLNGRPRQRLIDPEFDLGSAEPSFRDKPWILPLTS